MAATTKTQIANVNSYYDRTLLTKAVPLITFDKWGQVRNIPANNSDVIKFRRYGLLSVATTPLTEGTTPAGSQLSVTTLSSTALQYGDYVTLTDKLKFETEDPIESEAVMILGEQMAETIDILTRDILVAGTTIQYASSAVSRVTVGAAMKLTASEIKLAVRTMKNNKARKITSMVNPMTGIGSAPVDAAYIAVCHPNTTYDLKADALWVGIEKYAAGLKNGPLPGEVGKLDEVRFVETTQAKTFTGAGAAGIDVYATLIFGADAYGVTSINALSSGVIRQDLGSAGSADPLNQRATIGWKSSYITTRLNESFMLRIEHATS